jgi:non-specific serine/threonine protein kinase
MDALMTGAGPCFAPIEQMVESADIPLRPSVDLYALAGVARYWISGQLPAPAFGAPDSPRREKFADTVQRLRLTWPQLHYSAALLDALDSALSIYPAERPQNVAQMRARLGTAPAAAGDSVTAASTAAPALNDAMPSSPAPAPQTQTEPAPAPTDRMTQDFDVVTSVVPDPEPLATSGLARIDDDPSVRTAFARQVSKPRRIARWSGAVLVLLALLLIGVSEFGQEVPFGRVLDALGISRGTGAGESAAESASAVTPAEPVTPPIAANAGGANPTPVETTAADSSSATAPASPASAPIGANAGGAAPDATAPASLSSPDRTTPSAAATAAPAAPRAIAQPPTPPPTRSAQQHAARAPASPREACGPRTQFSLYRCMKTQCSQRRWASHAQCERLRTTDSVD